VPDELAAEHPDGTVVELPDGRLVTIDLSAAIDVQTEGAAPMQVFTDYDGSPVWVRSVRVAFVREDNVAGTQIYFPGAEDPVHVAEQFAAVVSMLQPALQVALIQLTAEEGAVAVNPRYILSVAESVHGGARVAVSGGRALDVTQSIDDVISALGP
jgi:hypothetical protein